MDPRLALLSAVLIWLPRFAGAQGHTVFHPTLGYRFRPNADAVSEKRVKEALIYRATYHGDALGRRIAPISGAPRSKFAAFFGDSNVFGEGLDDAQTLPARFAEAAPEYVPYNYGFSGWGPAQALLLLKRPEMPKEIPQKEGIGFYGYYTFHKDRVRGDTKVIDWSKGAYPCFELDDKGKATFQGSFEKRYPYRVWLARKMDPWLKRFAPNLSFPLRSAQGNRDELTCELLTEAKETFTSHFPGSPFVVVLLPHTNASDPIYEACLAPRGIESLDLRKILPKGKEADFFFPQDGHLNPAGAALVAKKIAEWNVPRALASQPLIPRSTSGAHPR